MFNFEKMLCFVKHTAKPLAVCIFILGTIGQSIAVDYSSVNKKYTNKYTYSTQREIEQPYSSYNSVSHSTPKHLNSSKYIHLIKNQDRLNGCWDSAGAAYGVDPWLLFAIAKVESGFNSNAINRNKNKSTDFGMMQINDLWLPTLKKYGISTSGLYDPCTSIHVGAWIVSQNIKRFGYNQDGIGAYNSPSNVVIRRKYAQKVYSAYHELTRDFGVR